ncbi:hypothetical protein N7462_004423 [Penicillium macrosclerotiorum]|uniref:uncharacterized protein n=1 Tax=Penicillium macrosclerotiorum TaxID=303699 RepID=UPI002548F94F|nr:uncharacterized protein N7462_004423 [Penicillium macrosclerotiorum]KAJ5690031.1 hypothetical protein N7462_004423 [Penicillium macrosclerotiorum]
MPDVIDLISSDPPLPERARPQRAPVPSRQVPARPSANSRLISSDSIDVSVFNYDDFLDKPPKKRRVGNDNRPHLRKAATAHDATGQNPSHSFLFSDDDFALPPSNHAALKKRPEYNFDAEELDPILFTSSAPEPSSKYKLLGLYKSKEAQPNVITLDDDNEDIRNPSQNVNISHARQEDIEEFSDPFLIPGFADEFGQSPPRNSATNLGFSSKTAALLAELNATTKDNKSRTITKGVSHSRRNKCAMVDLSADELDEPAESRRPAKKSGKLTAEEKDARTKARAEAKAQKDHEKQLEKERKQRLKEEKAKQKQLAADISEVNKLKVDKKDSTQEMILDISCSLEESKVGNQTVEFMKRLGVEYSFFTGPVTNMVKWRRKMNAKYNEAAGHWEPCAFHIAEEKHVLCLMPAQDFVDMVIAGSDSEERESLEIHVLKIKSAYPDCTIIYLIEGLTAWMRKNRNSRNRAYQAEVLSQYEPAPTQSSTAPRGRGRKPKNKPETTPPVDDDVVEDALLALQVIHSCLIHHTNAPPESAEWIKNFTEHVSTIPYRRERMEGNDAAFCMDVGQVRTGEDKLDTFIKMLQEINRVTASMAYGISGQYSCVTDLVRGMRMHGPTMLEDVRKSANRNGGLTDSRVGPAASKRLHKVFTGLDPNSTDV